MTAYELRLQLRMQPAAPRRDDSGPWHIVEAGGTEGLCHARFAPGSPARPLIDLADLSPDDRCLPCERTYRVLLTRPIPWPGGAELG